ncbi:hypothetical protein [uncultured Tenacibaculum sp.]|uniref:hypothetical protein n=1 Tax=uncultured Tenacibaculum sp. TaxID=174713 RepID=UPI00260B231A|nr:hypothetical protein [uncultured Tenacibaculum sp.]
MLFFKKIKAGALQYVLVISVIIAFILFAFISLIYLQQQLQIKNTFYKEAIENVQSAFNSIDHSIDSKSLEKKYSENRHEKTTFSKEHWGIFDIVSISSVVKNESFQKIGLIGYQDNERDALYLKENNTPLVLVGNTTIKGNVSLPKKGTKRGNIAGISYYGNQLINGLQKKSKTSLPPIKNINYIKSLFNRSYMNNSIENFELEENLKLTQSFNKPTIVHYTEENINLSNIELQGNIIIHSKNTITIDKTAILKDIILIASSIKILKNTTGNFQAFAQNNIIVEENCTMNYPTALILQQQGKTDEKKLINIGKNATIKGALVYYNDFNKKDINFNPQVYISENSTIIGELYCNQNLELLGNVHGTVCTNNFITKQYGSVYINHLYNGIINSYKLPKQYCGLFIGDKSLKVAKWLY